MSYRSNRPKFLRNDISRIVDIYPANLAMNTS